ncbi:mitochondrion protein [Artomyces pyxidatus]|uniref:Mitochondrion protein n=1 Tax=Artomyces pyxidatus TaxID=48021 RepID=A0ACB8TJN7_9AGAM|nr:mitochondrion protein [Artomyces pyxidatus]
MKSDAQKLQEHQHAVAVGGAKGLFAGLAAALPASYIANQRWHYYRTLPPSLKALGVVVVALPSFVISAETSGRRFEEQKWHDTGKQELETVRSRADARWESMTVTQKVLDVTARHQFSVIAGCWALGIAGAFGAIMRNPYQSLSQKVVQARMWSQGMTIGIVVAAAAISRSQNYRRDLGDAYHPVANTDHSWADIIAAGEQRKAQARAE